MREVTTRYAKENQVLGQTLYDSRGDVMYEKGTQITLYVRTRIHMEGHETIQVYDTPLEYQLEEVIRPEIQNKTMQQLRNLVRISTMENQDDQDIQLNIIRAMMGSVVEDFLGERAVMEKVLDMKKAHEYLYQHSVGVMITSLLLGTSIGLERDGLKNLGLSALLHDIGMLTIPSAIMRKEKLSDEEYEAVKNHSQMGYGFLKENTLWDEVVLLPVLQHQERWDGSGYPQGLSGDDIAFHAQIIGLADVFDSMITDRVHRKAFPVSEAYEFIMGDGGNQFNPQLIQAFVNNINPYPLNTLVELNDQSKGVVEKTNSPFHTRPVLRIVQGPLKGEEVNLLEQRNLVITRTIKTGQ